MLARKKKKGRACLPFQIVFVMKASRRPALLAETATDVFLGFFLFGVLEDDFGAIVFHQMPYFPTAISSIGIVKRGQIRDPRSLLHIVGDNHNRVLLFEFLDQFLDFEGGNGVKGGAGFIHENDFRGDRDRPRNT